MIAKWTRWKMIWYIRPLLHNNQQERQDLRRVAAMARNNALTLSFCFPINIRPCRLFSIFLPRWMTQFVALMFVRIERENLKIRIANCGIWHVFDWKSKARWKPSSSSFVDWLSQWADRFACRIIRIFPSDVCSLAYLNADRLNIGHTQETNRIEIKATVYRWHEIKKYSFRHDFSIHIWIECHLNIDDFTFEWQWIWPESQI